MTKAERIQIEEAARQAVGRKFGCKAESANIQFPDDGPRHEFDIYAQGVVIGGVSTSPLTTSGGNSNTGGCDRACSELLWLTLWPGGEERIHVLTDKPLAEWLVTRYQGAPFPRRISIYHYGRESDVISHIGILGA